MFKFRRRRRRKVAATLLDGEGMRVELGRVFEPGWLEIFEEALAAAFAAVTAFAVAAETATGVEEIRAIDPDDACFELRSDLKRNVDAFGPDASGEAVGGVVGELDGFGRCAKGHGGENGAENFLLGDDGSGMDVAEKSGRKIKAARGHGNLRLPAGGAFGDALIHEALNAIELNAGDDGANVDGFIERRADAECVHAVADFGDEGLGDALLHEEARAGAADLALVEPDAVHEAFDGGVEVGILENDEGRFAAELERKFFVG